jgi:hypothetical protein
MLVCWYVGMWFIVWYSYKELAQTGAGYMSEADLMQVLGNAVTTAILAPAGPSRARLLALLYAGMYCALVSPPPSRHIAGWEETNG